MCFYRPQAIAHRAYTFKKLYAFKRIICRYTDVLRLKRGVDLRLKVLYFRKIYPNVFLPTARPHRPSYNTCTVYSSPVAPRRRAPSISRSPSFRRTLGAIADYVRTTTRNPWSNHCISADAAADLR